jgi:hypothetical protein
MPPRNNDTKDENNSQGKPEGNQPTAPPTVPWINPPAFELPVAKTYFVIELQRSSDPNDPGFEFVGVNGKNFQLNKGVRLIVPDYLLHALAIAKQKVPVKNENDQIVGSNDIQTLPFSVFGTATKAEYDAQNGKAVESAQDSEISGE